jgi:hypothetical protein
MSAASQVLELVPNVPFEVALKFPTGKRIATKRGPRVLFTLDDDRVMFVDPPVADKIEGLGLPAGETLRICKSESIQRGRPMTEWYVGTMGDESWEDLLNVRTKPAPAAAPQAAKPKETAPKTETHAGVQSQSNINGAAKPKAPPIKPQYGDAMAEFLILALKAAQEAEGWAAGHNCSVRFTSADVQGLASTLFIQAARDGYVTWKPGAAR